jgi:hypothetical protein
VFDWFPQGVPEAGWFASQLPAPSQLSGRSQVVLVGSPQGAAFGSKFGRHVPAPSQVSALSHALSTELPQGVSTFTLLQVPTFASTLQATQSLGTPPLQAVLQQTPSTQ